MHRQLTLLSCPCARVLHAPFCCRQQLPPLPPPPLALQGREDLRADARLMQMLRACHAALQAPGATHGSLAVHCFEITPLGTRLGLVQVRLVKEFGGIWSWAAAVLCILACARLGIGKQHLNRVTPLPCRCSLQWVEGAVPLYELYTGWQQAQAQRQRLLAAAAQQQQQQQASARAAPAARVGRVLVAPRAGAVGAAPSAVVTAAAAQRQQQLRPVELFYTKLKVGVNALAKILFARSCCSIVATVFCGRFCAPTHSHAVFACPLSLQEAGIDPASPRSAWPLPKLVRVLQGMQQTGESGRN